MCEQQRVQNLSREAPKCCAWQHQGGGRCPCQQKRAARLPSPETRSGTVQSLKCCLCQQKRAARLPSAVAASRRGGPNQVLRLHQGRGGAQNALGYRAGGPETRLGTVQSLKCCPCQQKRAARLRLAASIEGAPKRAGYRPEPEVLPLPAETSREAPKCCAWQHQGGGGPRNALGYRPEPEVLPLPAETSREAPKCCAWQHQEGGPETRSGTVQSLKCCPCQQKRAARSRGGPETRSGTVQSLKCCPCQQKRAARLPSAVQSLKCCLCQRKRAARLPSAAAGSSIKGGGPETRSGTVQSLKCCPCQRKRAARLPSAAVGSIEPRGSQVLRLAASRGGPRNALGYRPEPEVLPLPAETSREAPKCCAWQHQEGGPETRKCCPCQQKRGSQVRQHQGGGPRNALGHRLVPLGHRERRAP